MTCASCPPAERRAAFLALGLVAAFYLATLGRPSFWLDEAWEANFYAGHTAAPWYNRPILYMAASLAVARTIGPHEFALRFFPCAAGIAAIALTWRVARRSLGPAEAWVAAGLLTIAPAFLEASHQLKNYALDAFFTIALVASYERYFRNRERRELATHAGLAAVSFGFSFPSVLVVAAIGAIEIVRSRSEPRRLARWLGAHAIVALAFAANYFGFHTRGANAPGLLAYFAEAWPPLDHPQALPGWLASATARLLRDQTGIESGVAALLLVAAGIVIGARRRASWALLLPFAAALNAAAAALKLYPYGVGRLSVYLAPVIAIGAGASLCALVAPGAGRAFRALAVAALAYPLLYPPLAVARPYLTTGWRKEHIRPLVATLAREHRPGETIAVNDDAFPAFTFYWRRDAGNRDRADVVSLKRHRDDPSLHGPGVRNVVARGPQLWTLLTHMPPEEKNAVLAFVASQCRRESSLVEGDARLDRWTCGGTP